VGLTLLKISFPLLSGGTVGFIQGFSRMRSTQLYTGLPTQSSFKLHGAFIHGVLIPVLRSRGDGAFIVHESHRD